MADPFSIVLGVISLAGTALTAAKGACGVLTTIQEGPETVSQLKGDLGSLATLFKRMQDDLASIDKTTAKNLAKAQAITLETTEQPLRDCIATCKEIQTLVDKEYSHTKDGKRSIRDGVKNHFNGSKKVKDWQIRLESHKSTLTLALTFASLKLSSPNPTLPTDFEEHLRETRNIVGNELQAVERRRNNLEAGLAEFDLDSLEDDTRSVVLSRHQASLASIVQQEEGLKGCAQLIQAIAKGAAEVTGHRFFENQAFGQAKAVMGNVGNVPQSSMRNTYEHNRAHDRSTQIMGNMDGESFEKLMRLRHGGGLIND